MPVSRGLRQRVALAIALLSIFVVSAHSVAIYVVTDDQEETQINDVLADEVEAWLTRLRADPRSPPPRSNRLTSYLAPDPAARAELPAFLRDLPIGVHEVFVDNRELHVVVRPLDDGLVYLTYDAEPHEQRLRDFLWLLIFGILITAAAAAALGYWIAGLLTRPVIDLAARVGGLGPVASAPPVAARYQDEEVRRLAQAFDEYAARMAQFIAREQEFTGNVSHELRTPLTAIRTSCELLLADTEISEEARTRVTRIQRGAEQMAQLIQSLLLLARAHRPQDAEPIALRHCLDEAAAPLRETMAARHVEFANDVPAGASAQADRGVLDVVLRNVLSNAVAHTEDGRVAARLQDDALVIEDTGSGIAPVDLPHVFERFYRGRDAQGRPGHGLGLAIVKHLCDQHDWTLTLESEAGRGTRVRLRFAKAVVVDENLTLP
jgi:hypothetical protein